jgi:hypothetical protein
MADMVTIMAPSLTTGCLFLGSGGPLHRPGRQGASVAELDQAYDDRAGFIINLKVEPILDPLRSDPRFTEMVSRLKFSQ